MEGTVQKDVRSQSSEEAGVGGESKGTSCCLIISLSPLPPPLLLGVALYYLNAWNSLISRRPKCVRFHDWFRLFKTSACYGGYVNTHSGLCGM